VDNRRLLASGWTPLYPDWFSALYHDPDFLPSILSALPLPKLPPLL
jgi:hypothetical protein